MQKHAALCQKVSTAKVHRVRASHGRHCVTMVHKNIHSPRQLVEAHLAHTALVQNLMIGGVLLVVAYVLWRLAPLSRWRIAKCITHSKQRYAAKEYDDALASALEAKRLARVKIGASSETYETALMHLAATHAAMLQNGEALKVLDECSALTIKLHGEGTLNLVPICHARAEVYESDSSFDSAIQALEAARELRGDELGENSVGYGFSCVNLAGLYVRYASSVDMSPERRGDLVEKAADITIRGAEAAAGSVKQALEFIDEVLELIARAPHLGELTECRGAIGTLEEAADGLQQQLQ
tara:strand:- start:3840 stop:4730 length:891 start_codon:yes stop_codon:yes gene_type:complete